MALNFIKKHFPNSEFLSNTIILIAGTVIAQAIPLLIHPFLRRLYSPEDFGAFAIYFNIISIIIFMANFRYEAAIVLPKNDVESTNVLSLSIILTFFFCLLLFVLLLFFNEEFCSLINFPSKYAHFLYLLPFSAMLFSFYQSFNFWLIRKKAFKASSTNKITRRSFEGMIQLSLGYKKYYSGLFIGDFIGNLANVCAGIFQIKKNHFNIAFVSKNKLMYVLKRYKGFPLNNFLPTLLSALATFLPFFLVNKYYSSSDLGYLDLTRLVLSIPLAFISTTISQVMFQQITSQKNNQLSVISDLKKILYIILGISILEFIVIQLFAPPLFAFVFGEGYHISGEYSKILVYIYIMNFVVSTYSSVFISFEKLKLLSIWQISYFLIICSLSFFDHIPLENFLIIYAIIEVLMSSIYCIMIYNVVKKYERAIKPLKK